MIVKSLPCTAGTIIIKAGAKHFFFFFFCGLEKERKRLKMSDYRPRLYSDEENASYSYTVSTEKVAMVYTVRAQRWGCRK